MQSEKRSWLWVPTAYFAEGGPYMVVSLVSAILFKSLGMENDDIALWTGLMMLPWSIKPLWAPFIDLFRTKRQWILATQLLMALLFAGMAALIVRESLSAVLIGFFFLLAFASATHDVAVDGFYLIALDKHTQALLAGIRGTFYRIASVSVQGGLVMLAGLIEKHGGSLRSGWAYSLLLAAGAMLALFLWHCLVLPRPADPQAHRPVLADLHRSRYAQGPAVLLRGPDGPAVGDLAADRHSGPPALHRHLHRGRQRPGGAELPGGGHCLRSRPRCGGCGLCDLPRRLPSTRTKTG